jgi:hypothetical protein
MSLPVWHHEMRWSCEQIEIGLRISNGGTLPIPSPLLSFTSASAQSIFTRRGYASLRNHELIAAQENDLLKQKESTRPFPPAFPKLCAWPRALQEMHSVSLQAGLRLVSATLCTIGEVLETHRNMDLSSTLTSGHAMRHGVISYGDISTDLPAAMEWTRQA